MKPKELFSRRNNLINEPHTLWDKDLPPDFLDGFGNILDTLFQIEHFRPIWHTIMDTLGWPRPRRSILVDISLDTGFYIDEFITTARKQNSYEILDAIEIIADYLLKHQMILIRNFCERVNDFMELKNINWRFNAEGKLVRHMDNVHVIENALSDKAPGFEAPKTHLEKAWGLFNKRPEPDLANSVKEAITAVESAVKTFKGLKKGTLNDALKQLDIHSALREGLGKLYAYCGDEPGIRHGAMQSPDVTKAEAELILTICAGLVTFIAALKQNSTKK